MLGSANVLFLKTFMTGCRENRQKDEFSGMADELEWQAVGAGSPFPLSLFVPLAHELTKMPMFNSTLISSVLFYSRCICMQQTHLQNDLGTGTHQQVLFRVLVTPSVTQSSHQLVSLFAIHLLSRVILGTMLRCDPDSCRRFIDASN